MTSSIFHLFRELLHETDYLKNGKGLEKFPFKPEMVSCRSQGKFPDLILRLNGKGRALTGKALTGGELIECKDSKSYTVASFNSTIPTGTKKIKDIIGGKNSKTKLQMDAVGEDIDSLPNRDVFYFIRGRNNKDGDQVKVCLIHGSFFCTIPVKELIQESFRQLFESTIRESDVKIRDKLIMEVTNLFVNQSTFSQVRTINDASVKLRFRVMSEVRQEANILSDSQYPIILDDSVNLILPLDKNKTEEYYVDVMKKVFPGKEFNKLKVSKLQHNFGATFLLFQQQI